METWAKKNLQLTCLIIIICTIVSPCYGFGSKVKTIDLTCKVPKITAASCWWNLNNTRLIKDSHFHFVVSDTNTRDCSIQVTNFDPALQRGYWSCHYLKKAGDKHDNRVGALRIDNRGIPHKVSDEEWMRFNNANGKGFDSKHLLTSAVVILSMFVCSGLFS